MTSRRVDAIVTWKEGGKLKGNTKLHVTDVIAGWCGVDFVSRVTFEHNSNRTLIINVEGTKYRIMGIRRSFVTSFVRTLLECPDSVERAKYLYTPGKRGIQYV